MKWRNNFKRRMDVPEVQTVKMEVPARKGIAAVQRAHQGPIVRKMKMNVLLPVHALPESHVQIPKVLTSVIVEKQKRTKTGYVKRQLRSQEWQLLVLEEALAR